MRVDVGVCETVDIDRLARGGADPRTLRRHRERYAQQVAGKGWHLLAWCDDRVVGHVTVTRESKYTVVREMLGAFPEMNALEAQPTGHGIGTALISSTEELAAAHDARLIGLAVAHTNTRARALYERLGYEEWDGGSVIDEWTERDADGVAVALHHDECSYLVKRLISSVER